MKPTPTINVNLSSPCNCGANSLNSARRAGNPNPVDYLPHMDGCPSTPVLIPCPIPRSVTFEVRLGECTCDETERSLLASGHTARCPGKPIRVSCSISGATWEESEVTQTEYQPAGDWVPDRDRPLELALESACRERWALVKGLVLGQDVPPGSVVPGTIDQRDAVYAEIAALARDEQSAFERQEHAVKAMDEVTFMPYNFHRAEPHARASASILARYVERLIEQIGVLP